MIKCLVTLIIIFFAMQQPAMASETKVQYEVWIDKYGLEECTAGAPISFLKGTYLEYPDYTIIIDPDYAPVTINCGDGTVTYYSQVVESIKNNDKSYVESWGRPAELRIQETTRETPPGEMCEEVATLPIEPNSWEGEEISFESLKSRFTSKFPLDMVFISSQNGGGNEDCPVFNLLGRSMPACIIIMLIKSAKWPILISIIIRTIFSI